MNKSIKQCLSFIKKHIYLILLISFFSLYTLEGIYLLDPDFGWHLRFGEIVLQTHSVPLKDLFSYTMPSYDFINHEWFSDVIIAVIYHLTGLVGVAIFFGLFVTIGLGVVVNIAQKKDKIGFWLSLLTMVAVTMVQFAGIRPQALSWTFFVLVWYLLDISKNKWRFIILPIIFLIWANLHAAFALGLFLFFVAVINSLLKKDRSSIYLLISFIISTGATLINPYGFKLWQEVILTSASPQISTVEEWTPSFTHIIFPMWLFIDFSLILLWFNRSNVAKKNIFLLTVIGILFLVGIRQAPLFMLFLLPLAIEAVNDFIDQAKKYQYAIKRLKVASLIVTIITVVFCIITLWPLESSLWKSGFNIQKSISLTYPSTSVKYLKTHPFKGNYYSIYNWGGYLIWQLPNKKDFIDGRMPTWINPNAPKNESKNALQDFLKIDNPKILDKTIHKYHITTLIIAPLKQSVPQCWWLQNWCNQVIKQRNKQNQPLETYLHIHHWHELIHDKVSVVYQLSVSQ